MSARTTSSGTAAIHVSTQPQTTHHANKSVDFFFAHLIEWLPPPLASRHESHPRRHKSVRNNPIDIIYKYVASGGGSVLSGNNIRPFKYIYVVWGVLCVTLGGGGG